MRVRSPNWSSPRHLVNAPERRRTKRDSVIGPTITLRICAAIIKVQYLGTITYAFKVQHYRHGVRLQAEQCAKNTACDCCCQFIHLFAPRKLLSFLVKAAANCMPFFIKTIKNREIGFCGRSKFSGV